ncbi:MAG: anthranilate phosphoribosyltransferase [Deltaproteobacteria bacterium]|nr:anthranilate phosphoribosyltransferase [Deltaproteobacteria bacterium]
MQTYLDSICRGVHLSHAQASDVFGTLVAGDLDPVQISALLVALRAKGEQPEEIAGAAQALRDSAVSFPRPDYRFADSCGTGGDGAGTINISTTVAVVAAEMGIPLAKHGNRSVSSSCGSADVLEQLGVKIDAPVEVARRCLDEVGLCFLFAPSYHQGLRHAMSVRRTLSIRTIMNVLGPLVNPARPAVQMVGVYDPALCVPLARTLGLLGCEAALVVHGSGLDEVALHGPTQAALLSDGGVIELTIRPEHAGLDTLPLGQLEGGGPERNASKLRSLLEGRGNDAHVAAVAINAGALAWVFGNVADIRGGTDLALEVIGSGRAAARLERLARLSHGAD